MRFDRTTYAGGAAALLLALTSVPALADVKAGVEMWRVGNFGGAVQEWRPMAESGDADAQFNMGQAYRLGRGVPSDYRIAASWFQKAAAQGHVQAQTNLGLTLYDLGQRKDAMKWIPQAAARGDARAQYAMAVELANGELVERDLVRAYALMTRAAAQGMPAAANALDKMKNFIGEADRQKGTALARQMEQSGSKAPAAAPAPAKAKAMPLAKAPATAPAPAQVGGRWRVQFGAYASEAAARTQWATLSKKIAGASGLQASYEKAGALTRLRAGPLADRAAADRLCAAAKASGQACFVVAPGA